MLCHANPQVRSAAFSLATQSSSFKEPLAETTLTSLRFALQFYHAEASPKVRQENLASIRKLLQRLDGSLDALSAKDIAPLPRQDSSDWRDGRCNIAIDSRLRARTYQQHLAFFAWYSTYLTQELSPTASYQRHVVALNVIEFLISNKLFTKYHGNNTSCIATVQRRPHTFVGDDLLTSLLDLVMDSFDDIRELAASILHSLPSTVWSGLSSKVVWRDSRRRSVSAGGNDSVVNGSSPTNNLLLTSVLHRATRKMQHTGRADHADGFGRLYDLILGSHQIMHGRTSWTEDDETALERVLSRLEECIEIARANIQEAVRTASLHGYLIAARYNYHLNLHKSLIEVQIPRHPIQSQ